MIDSFVVLRDHKRQESQSLPATVRHDIYCLILRRLQTAGVLRDVHVVFHSDRSEWFDVDGLNVYAVRSLADLPDACLTGDHLFVRGDKRPYLPALRRGKWSKWTFYGASRRFFPRYTWGYNGVFVDEPEHLDVIARNFPRILPLRFIKTADDRIFKPLPGAAKHYDVCCFGHMNSHPKNFKVLPTVVKAKPQYRYVMIGRKDERLAQELDKICPTITYAGAVSQVEANRLLNQSRMGLILSAHDGAPRTILESMAAGLPQLVNRQLVAGRCYINERTGVVAEVVDFPERIDYMLETEDRFQAAAEFQVHFSPNRATQFFADNLAKIEASDIQDPPRWQRVLLNTGPMAKLRALRLRGLAARYCD